MSNTHAGVRCDACDESDFRLYRFKCLICDDYDLCGFCFSENRELGPHVSSHPMQCILLPGDIPNFYGKQKSDMSCYTCPLCGQMGFDANTFNSHVYSKHRDNTGGVEVLCPVCCLNYVPDSSNRHDDLVSHIIDRHRFTVPKSESKANEWDSNPELDILTSAKQTKEHNSFLFNGVDTLKKNLVVDNSPIKQEALKTASLFRANKPKTHKYRNKKNELVKDEEAKKRETSCHTDVLKSILQGFENICVDEDEDKMQLNQSVTMPVQNKKELDINSFLSQEDFYFNSNQINVGKASKRMAPRKPVSESLDGESPKNTSIEKNNAKFCDEAGDNWRDFVHDLIWSSLQSIKTTPSAELLKAQLSDVADFDSD